MGPVNAPEAVAVRADASFPRYLIWVAAALSAMALLGWWTNTSALFSLFPGLPYMGATTAFAMLLAAAAVRTVLPETHSHWRIPGKIFGLAITLMGAGTLGQYTLDQTSLFGSLPVVPPSPYTAVDLVLLGLA